MNHMAKMLAQKILVTHEGCDMRGGVYSGKQRLGWETGRVIEEFAMQRDRGVAQVVVYRERQHCAILCYHV